jgi:UDP-glucose 4-epimerase
VDIDGSSILVTGGAGLIGSATIDLLRRDFAPARIVVIDNLSRGRLRNIQAALKDPRVELIEGDIRDVALVNRVVQGMDAVLHMAALRITACAAAPREALEVMCDGSFNVIEAASRARVKKVVAASSASVYGQAESFPTSEDHHPYNNQTWYGATKALLEGLLRTYHASCGLPYVALRYFNVYGPRMDTTGKYTEVLIRWMESIAARRRPLILGDGSHTMDFVYIDDAARATVLSLLSEVVDDVFNVGSGIETSLRELAEALLRVMKSDLRPEYGPNRNVNANAVLRRLADTSKARRALGFTTEVGLEEGLSRLVGWWCANREGLAA